MPKLSVIMSVYNGAKYLTNALDSILNQTYTDFEFIIFEDGSTDNSLEILKKYTLLDSRIILIEKEKNIGIKGFIENLNSGLKIASGKLIARMDQDDISLPTRFEKQITYLENNPDIYMVGSSLNVIDENNQLTRLMDAPESDKDIRLKMYKHISMYHPAIMFRNDNSAYYREKMLYCEDYDMYLRLMLSEKKFANIKEPLLEYRILQSSISRKDNIFIRRLFVEKARYFFKERQKSNHDSYDSFSPDHFTNILEKDISVPRLELIFAITIAIKYNYKTIIDTLLIKANLLYPKDRFFKRIHFTTKLPFGLTRTYYKLFLSI